MVRICMVSMVLKLVQNVKIVLLVLLGNYVYKLFERIGILEYVN